MKWSQEDDPVGEGTRCHPDDLSSIPETTWWEKKTGSSEFPLTFCMTWYKYARAHGVRIQLVNKSIN